MSSETTGANHADGGGAADKGAPDGTPLAHEGLGITVTLPAGWAIGATATFPLQLFAPARAGYRTNLAFSTERFAPPAPAGLEEFVRRLRAAQVTDYPGFAEERLEEIVVDGRPGLLQRYSWRPEPPLPPLVQLLILLVTAPGELLEVDGATLAEGADATVPLLEATVRSLAFAAGPGPGR